MPIWHLKSLGGSLIPTFPNALSAAHNFIDIVLTSGAFIFLEDREAAFALINSADPPGRQAFTAAHEYCHYLKDRHEGPLIENPDVFIDEYVSLYHPREKFAHLAASGCWPAARLLDTSDLLIAKT